MAQYGKALYGSALYGYEGTQGGQYTSPEIDIDPLLSLTGGLAISADWYLPDAVYMARGGDFKYTGTYFLSGPVEVNGAQGILQNTGTPGSVALSFVGEGYTIKYYKGGANYGSLKINRSTFVNGEEDSNIQEVIDTSGTGTITSGVFTESVPFGEHVVTLSFYETSAPDSYIVFESLTTKTTKILFDFRTNNGTWGNWARINPTLALKNEGTYRYHATATSASVTGVLKYQFKYTILSSDDQTIPGVLYTDFNISGANGRCADRGTLEILIDLKEVPRSLDTIDYVATIPDNSELLIQSSISQTNPIVAGDEVSSMHSAAWSNYALPYKPSTQHKVWLNNKTTPVPLVYSDDGTVFSPVIDLVSEDTLSRDLKIGETSPLKILDITWLRSFHSMPESFVSITYFVYDASTWKFSGNMTDTKYIYYVSAKPQEDCLQSLDLRNIAALNNVRKVRIRADLKIRINTRTTGTYPYKMCAMPEISFFNTCGLVSYTETVGIGNATKPAFGSAVYNNNTGNFHVTSADEIIVPSGLGYNVPHIESTGVNILPDYRIWMRNSSYKANELRLFWSDTNSTKTSSSSAELSAEMRAVPDYVPPKGSTPRLYKHYLYAKGTLFPGEDREETITNAFRPEFNDPKIPFQYTNYSYYLTDGWHGPGLNEDSDGNTGVVWKSLEHGGAPAERDKITEAPSTDAVLIEISSLAPVESMPWTSGEYLSDPNDLVIVNDHGDTAQRDTVVYLRGDLVTDMIPAYVNVEEDQLPIGVEPSTLPTPYRIEIIDRSIIEHGRVIDNKYDNNGTPTDVVTATVQYTGNSFLDVLAPGDGEEPIEITRDEPGIFDQLPFANVSQIVKIMSYQGGPAEWSEGVHYNLGSNKKTIDWTPSYDEVDGVYTVKASLASNPPPAKDEVYYVELRYYKINELKLTFSSPKSETVDKYTAWNSATMTVPPTIETYIMPLYETDITLPAVEFNAELPSTFVNGSLEYYIKDDNPYIESSVVTIDSTHAAPRFIRRVKNPIEDIVLNIKGGSYSCNNKEYMIFDGIETDVETIDPAAITLNTFSLTPTTSDGKDALIEKMVIEKSDGTPLKFVAFIDDDNKTYTIFNMEKQPKPETPNVYLAFDDVDDVDNSISIYNSDGSLVTQAVTLVGKRLTFDSADLANMTEEITIRYALKDSFTFNYSEENPGTVDVTLNKTPAEAITVYSQLGADEDIKAIWWLKFNALYNHMPYGFVYLTQTADQLKSFIIHVSPDCILRDGNNYAIISIDSRDKYNNPVSNADLTFSNVNYGTITKITCEGPVIEGRSMYKYTPRIANGPAEEKITVLDGVSGLSSTFKIKLK